MPETAPVVLVPGMLCDADLWRDVRDKLDVAVHDVELTASSIGGMADQVLASAPPCFTLVGLSLGAIVGFEVARRSPERVAGFCAISTNCAAPRADQLADWQAMAQRVEGGDFDGVVEEILPTMFSASTGSWATRFRGMASRIGPEVFRAQLAAQATRVDARPGLQSISSPSLVVCGAGDQLCPVSFHREIAAHIDDARLRVVPRAGHLLPIEKPAVLTDLLKEFLWKY